MALAQHDLASRIDVLAEKVDHLVALVDEDRRARLGVRELMSDSAPIATAAFERVAATLDERRIDVAELGDLALRLAEAAPDLNRALQTFQALAALTDDLGPLTSEAFELVATRLDELDRRGYFTWFRGGFDVLDRIVASFDEEDIAALGDNVVLIFETIKEMTQPDVMHMVQRSARLVREDVEPEKISMFRLLREMRDPEVRLGLHRMLTVLRGMAVEQEPVIESTTPEEE